MASVALDVEVFWCGDPLAAHRFDRDVIVIGDDPRSIALTLEAPHVLARFDRERGPVVDVPASGALLVDGAASRQLAPGERVGVAIGQRVELAWGSFELVLEAVRAEAKPRRSAREMLGGANVHVALAAALHVALLFGAGRSAYAASNLVEVDDATALRDALAAADAEHGASSSASRASIEAAIADALDDASPGPVDARAEHLEARPRSIGAAAIASPRSSALEPRREAANATESAEDARAFARALGLALATSQGPGGRALDAVAPLAGPSLYGGGDEGAGGLGLSGIGEGGGGAGEGVGVDRTSLHAWADPTLTARAASAHGHLRGSHRVRPIVHFSDGCSVSGRLPPESVKRVVQQSFGRFRACYEPALAKNPTLAGRISTRFVIARDGAVAASSNAGGDLPDPDVVSCVTRAFATLSFPAPIDSTVTVVYPILFLHD